jgi:hypothetical protein
MIDLLPKEQIRELKEEENLKIILNLFFLISFFIVSIFLILISIKFYLTGILNSLKIPLEKEEKILNLEKENEIKNYNQILSKTDSFLQKKIFLFPKLEEFFKKIPDGVRLRDLEMKIDKKGEIFLSFFGISETRGELLNLIRILKENYKEVSFPPEILLKENQIDFSISFKIK